MTPNSWNLLLRSTCFTCIASANAALWFVLTVTHAFGFLAHWHFAQRPWGVLYLLHQDSLTGFSEDIMSYLVRMSAVLLFSCWLINGASFLTQAAPRLASHLASCGSRIRYTITLFALWYVV